MVATFLSVLSVCTRVALPTSARASLASLETGVPVRVGSTICCVFLHFIAQLGWSLLSPIVTSDLQ